MCGFIYMAKHCCDYAPLGGFFIMRIYILCAFDEECRHIWRQCRFARQNITIKVCHFKETMCSCSDKKLQILSGLAHYHKLVCIVIYERCYRGFYGHLMDVSKWRKWNFICGNFISTLCDVFRIWFTYWIMWNTLWTHVFLSSNPTKRIPWTCWYVFDTPRSYARLSANATASHN